MPEDYTKKIQTLLRKLFQFESAELDFGIYRIMNRKRDVIEKFIEKDLIASVDTEFGRISATSKMSAKKELDELKTAIDKTLGSSALLTSGDFNPQFVNTPIGADLAKQYKEKIAAYASASVSSEHKAEVFNHIYQFFSRYYDNGDFMSLRRYSAKQKFAVPYNGEEVLLQWANKNQYFIKTGEYFFNYAFRVGEYAVRFRIVQAETSMNNTKGESRFFVLNADDGNITYEAKTKELVILFEYRALTDTEKAAAGSRNVQDTLNEQAKNGILTYITDSGLKAGLSRETDGKTPLTRHLSTYAKRNTTDYFIHKDLTGFLKQELDFYIKNEMFDLDDLGTEKEVPIEQYLNRVRVMKAISLKIIAFLSQIEDFQKKLFKKKKFVLNANYCMTLDRVPAVFYREIAKNTSQMAEWKSLYGVGESGGLGTPTGKKGNVIDEEFLKDHPYLVLDTKFFPQEFKDRFLSNFDDIDEVTGGLMINSENWQALNLLQHRYREQVKCIYIDPPYNTGNDGFVYKDNYQHSSWLSMMGDRFIECKNLWNDAGTFIVHMDEHEISNLETLLAMSFDSENNLGTIVWDKRNPKGDAQGVATQHEYLLCWAKNEKCFKNNGNPLQRVKTNAQAIIDKASSVWQKREKRCLSEINKEFKEWMRLQIFSEGEKAYNNIDENGDVYRPVSMAWPNKKRAPDEYFIPLIHPLTKKPCPVPQRGWRSPPGTMSELIKKEQILFGVDHTTIPNRKYLLKENMNENIPSLLYFGGSDDTLFNKFNLVFENPKPVSVSQYVINSFCSDDGMVLDYFAGSGTTAHAILNLNKKNGTHFKYLLVEMGSHYDTVLKPRIQKVMYSSEWKDGKPQNTDGISHMFKYLTLEQYEDTLNNIDFMEGGTVQKTLGDMDGYVLRYMLDFETRESPCRMNVGKLERPFDYTLRITKDSELHDETVDLVETFNYLLGLKVKRVRTFVDNETTYRVVNGETLTGQPTTVIWRTTAGLELRQDKKFIEEKILTDPKLKAERVFINGDFHVEGALPIEPEFQRLMGA